MNSSGVDRLIKVDEDSARTSEDGRRKPRKLFGVEVQSTGGTKDNPDAQKMTGKSSI